jgi:hypothetical protein
VWDNKIDRKQGCQPCCNWLCCISVVHPGGKVCALRLTPHRPLLKGSQNYSMVPPRTGTQLQSLMFAFTNFYVTLVWPAQIWTCYRNEWSGVEWWEYNIPKPMIHILLTLRLWSKQQIYTKNFNKLAQKLTVTKSTSWARGEILTKQISFQLC